MHVKRFSRRTAVFHEKIAPKITAEHSTPDYGLFQTRGGGGAILLTLNACISWEGRGRKIRKGK